VEGSAQKRFSDEEEGEETKNNFSLSLSDLDEPHSLDRPKPNKPTH